jgi:hypothetical protein
MKFTLIAEDFGLGYDLDSRTTKEFECDTYDIALMQIENFLRGCGFVFDGGLVIENNRYSEDFDGENEYVPRDCNDTWKFTIDELMKFSKQRG